METKEYLWIVKEEIKNAEAIVIGAGAGLSASAGLTYDGKRFENYFSDFIQKYSMEDMYSAGFYPFDTQEEKWAYWSKHIFYNRYDVGATEVYIDLHELVQEKNYFVEDEDRNLAANKYSVFLEENQNKKLLFLELGVGMNTPGIIKYPFWQMTNQWKNSVYVCMNKGQAWAHEEIRDRAICIDGDIGQLLKFLR